MDSSIVWWVHDTRGTEVAVSSLIIKEMCDWVKIKPKPKTLEL